MKHELDQLMKERGLAAIVVQGSVAGNPPMYYMTNGAGLTQAYVVQKRGEEPVLICLAIEREQAAASGLRIVNVNRYGYAELLREKSERLDAMVELHRRIFDDLAITGHVGFYGKIDQGRAWVLLNALDEHLDEIGVHGDFGVTVIDAARATKDEAEAKRVRQVGQSTCDIIGQTIEFLRSHAVKNDRLVKADGSPLTIGDTHQQIQRLIAEKGLEDPEGFIFSIGHDAAVPHNKGTADDVIELGKTIIFDIFPCEPGGGYFADVTRTFCLGYATEAVECAYQDVYDCQAQMLAAYETGEPTRRYQQMTCDFFESRGHPTVATDAKTEAGYVHSLGHGLGLAIHEEPRFSDVPSNTNVVRPGHLFTCEPGLYYPDRAFGIRIEDDVWISPEGDIHVLTDFPKELVIEL